VKPDETRRGWVPVSIPRKAGPNAIDSTAKEEAGPSAAMPRDAMRDPDARGIEMDIRSALIGKEKLVSPEAPPCP
jgi:hypothetical protein